MEFKAKKITVLEDEPFKNDKLEMEQHVRNLSLLLQNISSPIVFSINAPWGCGKTTFLEMLNADLKSANHKTIFFSAWETDFATDPLLAFIGEVNGEIESFIGKDESRIKAWDAAKKASSYIIKKGAPTVVKLATYGMIDIEEAVKGEISEFAKSTAGDAIDEYLEGRGEITKFKENIKKVFNNGDNDSKVYIFIDELDRCRPTYAIELLERIKHLLEIEGLVFILAMDKIQLSHSIKSVYGNEFEATGYLRRFIDIEYTLPKVNLDSFIDHLYQTFDFDSFFEKRKKYSEFQYDSERLHGAFKLLASSKKLSLREVEQLFAKVNLVLYSTKENIHIYPTLLAFLLIIKEFHLEIYNRYVGDNSTPEEVIVLLYEIIPVEARHESSECALIEASLISTKTGKSPNGIGQSMVAHNNILNNRDNTSGQRNYSERVTQIYQHLCNSGVSDGISLNSIASRINMLENFDFDAAKN